MRFQKGFVLSEHSEVLGRKRSDSDYGWKRSHGKEELKAPCIVQSSSKVLYYVGRGTPTYNETGDAVLVMSDESIVRVKNPYHNRWRNILSQVKSK